MPQEASTQEHTRLYMKILLIDDEEESLTAMSRFFVDRGYSVECASESEEAIAMIRHHRFDIVIVDLELNSIEGLNGFSVLKALRQSCPEAPAIVYSGHFGKKITEAVLRHGGTKFIAKPASLPQLLASVEELCPQPF
jgi:two-component system OmpR family response regulator